MAKASFFGVAYKTKLENKQYTCIIFLAKLEECLINAQNIAIKYMRKYTESQKNNKTMIESRKKKEEKLTQVILT